MTTPRAELAFAARCQVGEGPVWHADRLHWVDIFGGTVYVGDPATGGVEVIGTDTLVGAVAPARSGGYAAATREGFAAIAGNRLETQLPILRAGERMNDAKCDARGRLWAGSNAMDFDAGAGRLHVLEPDWTTRVVLERLTLPNGMGWSPDGTTFYLVDTYQGTLWAFDFDLDAGQISGRRLLRGYDRADGQPDGLCVDTDGCLWIAMWGGGRVERIGPDGDLLDIVPLPVAQPSSCAFGGAALDRLYVTSARDGLDLADPDSALDGSVFVIDGLGVSGLPVQGFGGVVR